MAVSPGTTPTPVPGTAFPGQTVPTGGGATSTIQPTTPTPTPLPAQPMTVGPTPYPPGTQPPNGAIGGGGTGSSGTTPTAGADQSSAKALLTAFMQAYGLGALADWAWQKHLAGDSNEEIMQEARQTPEYAARYPAMAELAKRGEAPSETAYINYEVGIKSALQHYGIPPGMYDTPQAIAKMMLNNVTVPVAEQRMAEAAVAAYSVPDSVRAAFATRVGVANTNGGLIAAYLDMDKALPLLEQQFARAQVAGASADARLAEAVNDSDINRLAARGLQYGQALQGFQQVAGTEGLGHALGGETASQETRIQAQLFGDAVAQATQQRVQKGRLVQFAQGGNLAESNQGVTGLAPSVTQ